VPAAAGAVGRPRRLPAALLVAFLVLWAALAIAPRYRQDWLLENVLVLIGVPLAIWLHTRVRFSNASCIGLFAFLVLHEIGAHYTYSDVPVEAWGQALLGISPAELFGFQRNHYDRLLHFLYGLLVTPVFLELMDARLRAPPLWRWMLVITFVTSHSLLYELIEWAAALVFGGELGMAYLGTQGDVWDAHKDMALALLGSVITATWLCRPVRARA
jgi:putative membrane protein